MHPLRLQYEMFSPLNPFLRPLLACAEGVREWRQPVAEDNVFRQAERQLSGWIEASLDAYCTVRDHMYEACFHAVYGAPLVQALVGLRGSDHSVRHRPGKDAGHVALVAQRIGELKKGFLCQVCGVRRVVDHPQAESVDATAMKFVKKV